MASASQQDFLRMMQMMKQLQPGASSAANNAGPSNSWAKPTDFRLSAEEFAAQIEDARGRWVRERRATPAPPRLRNKYALVQSMDITRMDVAAQSSKGGEDWMYSTSVGQEISYSRTDIAKLNPINLRDMQTHRVHTGFFLLCRVVGGLDRKVAAELIIEDQRGDAIYLSLYNFPGLFQANYALLQAVFPAGQLLIIREPWMKQPAATDGFSILRVDSPTDVIFLSGSESIAQSALWASSLPRVPYRADSASSLRALGATYFKQQLFIPAARVWSLAIDKDNDIPELFTNRAQAYITLGWFEAALRDTEHVLTHFPTSSVNSKARFRSAIALYNLSSYSEALESFRLVSDAIARDWEVKCGERMKETSVGDYNWVEMYCASQNNVPRLDVASFTGPIRVTTMASRGGGRGVLATKKIKTGDLLLVAKPFVSAFGNELRKGEAIMATNFLTQKRMDTDRLALLHALITKLHGAPECTDEILDLYAGPKFPNPPSTYPPASRGDTSLITPLVPPLDIDVTRIAGIVSCNVFGVHPLRPNENLRSNSAPASDDETSSPSSSSALYTLPSLFNHSCNSNAIWTCFGDVMVIRAIRDIASGSEITIPYRGFEGYAKRTEGLRGWLGGMSCDCPLCKYDRDDGKLAQGRRDGISAQLPFGPKTTPSDVIKLSDQLKRTYKGSESTREVWPEAFRLHNSSQNVFMQKVTKSRSQHEGIALLLKTLHHGFEALRSAGYVGIDSSTEPGLKSTRRRLSVAKTCVGSVAVPQDDCIATMIAICINFMSLGDPIRAERWYRTAWWVHEVIYGGRQALFDARFSEFVEAVGLPPEIVGVKYGWD